MSAHEYSNCRSCGGNSNMFPGRPICRKCRADRYEFLKLNPGTPRIPKRQRTPLMERLLKHRRIDSNGCWLWTAARDEQGYGHIGNVQLDDTLIAGIAVHRLMAHLVLKLDLSKPRSLYACHKCDVPPCFNPDHLFVGSAKDNSEDCKAKGRERHQVGEANGGGGKLSEADVACIKHRLEAGENQCIIAVDFAVDASLISRINVGKAWRHIEV